MSPFASACFMIGVLFFTGIIVLTLTMPIMVEQIQTVNNSHKQTVTSIVSSCTYDWFMTRTNVFLNNGLHLYYYGDLNFEVGTSYTVTYMDNTMELISWRINK